jgi:hypothetical protein
LELLLAVPPERPSATCPGHNEMAGVFNLQVNVYPKIFRRRRCARDCWRPSPFDDCSPRALGVIEFKSAPRAISSRCLLAISGRRGAALDPAGRLPGISLLTRARVLTRQGRIPNAKRQRPRPRQGCGAGVRRPDCRRQAVAQRFAYTDQTQTRRSLPSIRTVRSRTPRAAKLSGTCRLGQKVS